MQIDEIHVDGFGLMHGHVLEPGAGLTVIRGLNEAGKTTLLAFVRAILFGFETNRYRALAGGRRGGWVNVRTGDGRALRVERYGETGGQGRLRVLDADGRDLGVGELPILLQGVDQKLFQNVFAFGLDELAQFARLTEGEVAARIYGAGLGLGAVSALDVEANLDTGLDSLFKPGGQVPAINKLLRELEEVDGRLRGLDLPADYADAVRDLHDHEARLAELGSDIGSTNEERRHFERLRDAWQPWLRLVEARGRRDAMGAVVALPVDLPERLATLDTRGADSVAKAHDLAQRRAEAQSALDAIAVDDAVVSRRAEIDEVLRAAERDRARAREFEDVESSIRLTRRELDEALVRLGPGWTADRVAAFDDSVSVQSEISGRFRDRLERAVSELTSANGRRVELEREQVAVQAELDTLDAEVAEIVEFEQARPAVGELERRLTDIESAAAARDRARTHAESAQQEALEAASGLQHSKAEVADALRAGRSLRDSLSEERQVAALLASLPPEGAGRAPAVAPAFGIAALGLIVALVTTMLGAPVAVGIVIAIVGVLVAAAFWRRPSLAGWTRGGVGVRDSLTSRLTTVRDSAAAEAESLGLPRDVGLDRIDAFLEALAQEERAHARATSLQEAADRAGREVAEVEAILGALAVVVALSASPSEQEIDEFRKTVGAARDRRSRRLGLEEQVATLRRRLGGLSGRADAARQRVTDAQADDAAARAEWSVWLREHDLDPALDRETAKTVIDAVTAAKRPIRSLAALGERAKTLSGEHADFVAQVMATVASLGWQRDQPEDRSRLDRLLAELDAALSAALEADRARRSATQTLEELARDEANALVTASSDVEALQGLLTEHGAPDIAALRAAIAASDAARSVDDEIAECGRTLTALSGPGAAVDALLAELAAITDIADIQDRLDQVAARAGELDAEQARFREEAGALRESIAAMERDVAATADRQHREDLLAQLTKRAEDWSVLALARHVLSDARRAYEAAHRPAVIEVAESYFSEWTAGRYRRILAPLGRQVEAVEHRDGTQVPLTNLSTGTAQQLYLALRFGLVEHFAATAEPLPVVMDDILVNFDPERAALTARSIERLAERQQVIYFTCHPEAPLTSGTQLHLERLETVVQAAGARQASHG